VAAIAPFAQKYSDVAGRVDRGDHLASVVRHK
jgi:hypothetical protein